MERGGCRWWFLDIGGDDGLVPMVMMVTSVFKVDIFYKEELFFFILCGGICDVGSGCGGVCTC